MPRAQPPSAPGFWHCGRCGTPNPWTSYLTHCIGCGADRTSAALASRPAATAATTPRRAPTDNGRGRLLARIVTVASWAYAAAVLVVLLLIRMLGDHWLPATLLLFLPRVVWLLPLPVLALAALPIRGRRWGLWAIQAVTALVVLGPLMGLHVPWRSWLAGETEGTTIRIMTLNRHVLGTDPARLGELIETERIDVVCFQEFGADVPIDPIFRWGWDHVDDRTIFSRFPIVAELEATNLNEFPEYNFWPVRHRRAVVRLPDGRDVLIVSAHMPTARSAFALLLGGDTAAARRYAAWRWTQIGRLGASLAEARGLPTLLGGDLNSPADSPLMGLLRRTDLDFAFEQAGWGYGWTRPARWPWVGIDHILTSPHFAVRRCWVGPDVGSDHRPLIAEVVLPPAPSAGLPAPAR